MTKEEIIELVERNIANIEHNSKTMSKNMEINIRNIRGGLEDIESAIKAGKTLFIDMGSRGSTLDNLINQLAMLANLKDVSKVILAYLKDDNDAD